MKTLSVNDRVSPHRERAATNPGNGNRVKSGPARRQGLQVGHVLADRGTGREQLCVCRSRRIAGVVDIERVDTNKRGLFGNEEVGRVSRQEWVVAEIRGSTPVFREIGPEQDRAAAQVESPERVATDGAPGF